MQPAKTLIAREDINKGDLLVRVWRFFVRPARSKDTNIMYIAWSDAKKNERVRMTTVSKHDTFEFDL